MPTMKKCHNIVLFMRKVVSFFFPAHFLTVIDHLMPLCLLCERRRCVLISLAAQAQDMNDESPPDTNTSRYYCRRRSIHDADIF